MKKSITLIMVILLVMSIFQVSASEKVPVKTKTKNALKITHKAGKKDTLYVMKNQKIKIWYEGKRYKGRLDSISESKIFIKNRGYEISKIEKLKAKMNTGDTLFTIGYVAGGVAIVSFLLGMFLLHGHGGGEMGGYLLAMLLFIVGLILLPIGLILFFIGLQKKRIKTSSWKIESTNTQT